MSFYGILEWLTVKNTRTDIWQGWDRSTYSYWYFTDDKKANVWLAKVLKGIVPQNENYVINYWWTILLRRLVANNKDNQPVIVYVEKLNIVLPGSSLMSSSPHHKCSLDYLVHGLKQKLRKTVNYHIKFEQIEMNDLPEVEQFVTGSQCNSMLSLVTPAKYSEIKQKV